MPSTITSRIDGLTTSVAVKPPIKIMATAALTLSGEQTINSTYPDGSVVTETVLDGDRVGVNGQADKKLNGIYVCRTTAWERAKDFDGSLDAVYGTLVTDSVPVIWRLITPIPVLFGTSDIEFETEDGFNQEVADNLLNYSDPTKGAAAVGRAVRHINSIAELRALAGRYDGEVVYLRERVVGDGLGAGHFKWSATSVAADDDGVVVNKWIRIGADTKVLGEWFGVGSDGSDYQAELQTAINYAAAIASGSQGMSVYLPRGTIGLSAKITLPNRVAIYGANGRGTVVKPVSPFADTELFHAVNGTSSMFGSRLEDMYIDARGFNMTSVIRSQAWQETCGLNRVVIQYDGTTQNALLYTDGFGGAALLRLQDVEIFSDSTSASRHGIRVNQVSLVGGFVLMVENSTIAGSATNPLVHAINMVNDTLYAKGLHIENCSNGIISQGAGDVTVDTMTGSSTAVVDMISIGSGFTGKVNLRSIIPNGSTGFAFKNNVTGQNIAAADGHIAQHTYPVAGFNAHVSAQIANVTGDGTEYTIVYNTERFDLGNNFNTSTGIFTAPEQGKYAFNAAVKFIPGATITTCVIKIVTSNKEYHIYRGDTDSIRDGAGTVTLCGGVVADLDKNDTAKVNIIITGAGGDTVDIEPTETWFSGYRLGY